MDDVGKIWAKNEVQRRKIRTFKRRGVRRINSYQKQLEKLNRLADETILQIRKNV